MIKLRKYLKGSGKVIALILALLILQAWCELELPTYTSKIVTTGIQQGGVDSTIPERMRQQTLEDLKLFLSAEEAQQLEDAYTQEEGQNLVRSLKKLSPEEKQSLAETLTDAQILVLMLSSEDIQGTMASYLGTDSPASEGDGDGAAPDAGQNGAGNAGAGQNAWTLFAGDGAPIEALRKIPAILRGTMVSQIRSSLSAIPESTKEQIAIRFAVQEYGELGENAGARQNRYLLVTGAKMLLIALLAMAATISVSFLASRLAASTAKTLRRDVFRRVIRFDNEQIHRFSTASLITRSTNDIQQVQIFLAMGLRMLLFAPVMAAGGIWKVAHTDLSLGWIIVLAVVLLFLLILVLFLVAMPKFTILQTLIDRLNLVSREQITGVMVTRAFSAEKHEEERFEKANRDLTRTNLFVNRTMTFMMPVMMLIMNGVSVLIVYSGSHAIDRGQLQVGDMMAFIQYAMQIIISFLFISAMSIFIPRANVAAGRIAEVLETEPGILDPEHPLSSAPQDQGCISFEHVSFAYPDAEENVLTDISFSVKKGETLALIGSTGSGKSTLVSLIPRFYDVTEGCIRVGGVDVRDQSLSSLRGKIGYVPQKSILFTGTIRSNICFAGDKPDEENMQRAASIAQAEGFIREKEYGYDSGIAQGGTNVSGGQRQRLAIARAIAKAPEILIFDDSFSALDFRTDVALRRALKEQTSDTTVLIVAQRISTILHADQIIVLDEGKMAGIGTHSQLMESCEVYRQIAMSQLSEEELAG